MIYLHKILPLVFSPLFLIIFMIIVGIIFKSKNSILSSVVLLIFCSLPIFSNNLIAYLEKNYTLQKTSVIDQANAIVVLSGMLKTIKTEDGYKYEFGEAVDRILAGIDLYKNAKAPVLILTRGQVPWLSGETEGDNLKDFVIQFEIPEDKILLTDNVQNTDQEAKSVKNLLDKNDKIILVTSAFHMPRAQKVFEAAGINTKPFPVDFQHNVQKITILDFIPSAESFYKTSHFVREMIGRMYYNLKY